MEEHQNYAADVAEGFDFILLKQRSREETAHGFANLIKIMITYTFYERRCRLY
jgi:hypothetical protein